MIEQYELNEIIRELLDLPKQEIIKKMVLLGILWVKSYNGILTKIQSDKP